MHHEDPRPLRPTRFCDTHLFSTANMVSSYNTVSRSINYDFIVINDICMRKPEDPANHGHHQIKKYCDKVLVNCAPRISNGVHPGFCCTYTTTCEPSIIHNSVGGLKRICKWAFLFPTTTYSQCGPFHFSALQISIYYFLSSHFLRIVYVYLLVSSVSLTWEM